MLRKIQAWIFHLPLINGFLKLLSHINLPGFKGISLLDVAQQFRISLGSSRISMRAAAVSFNFILAIFPTIIFLFTLTAYLPIDNFQDRLLSALSEVLPQNTFLAIRNTILDIISIQRGGLLSFGVVVALFYATNGVHSIIQSFNASIFIKESRPTWKILLVSLALTIILSLLLVLATALMIATNFALEILIKHHVINYGINYVLIWMGKWLIFYLLLFFSVAFLYYLGPSKQARAGFFSIGALTTSFLILLLLIGFAFFVSNFGTYNTVYGSVGALIAFMVLINLNAMLLLAGYEFNAGVYHLKKKKSKASKNTDLS